jgi:DNA-binding transcriptional ArsR family regulator
MFMATHKELLLEQLAQGTMSRHDLESVVIQATGSSRDSVGRRLSELVQEGKVMAYREDGEVMMSLRPRAITVTEKIDLEQEILLLKEQNKDLRDKYKAALRFKQMDDALLDAYNRYGMRWKSIEIQPPVLQPGFVRLAFLGSGRFRRYGWACVV